MARTPKIPVDASVADYAHDQAKRRNIPTAELQGLAPDDERAVKTLRYPRNPDLDPQLVWRGKDAEDAEPLTVQAPPIYIQEKIKPQAIISDLRRRARLKRGAEPGPQADFFHDFNGLPDPEARTEFYAHDQNWSNRMILGDSLLVMGSLAEREALRGKVQMVFLDPPYGIKFNSNWQPSTKSRDVKDGKSESVSREPEVIKAFRDTWSDGLSSYLAYLRDRITLARDLLNESGSIFIQIGDDNLHLVNSLLDEVFGAENYVAKIAFTKTSGSTREFLSGQIDYIVWFAKDKSQLKFRSLYNLKSVGGVGASGYNQVEDDDGVRRPLSKSELASPLDIVGRVFTRDNLTSQSMGREKGEGSASWFSVDLDGRRFLPSEKGRWKTNEVGIERLKLANRLSPSGNTLRYVRYIDDFAGVAITDLWNDTSVAGFAADKQYVVETSTKVIERCMLMATDPGDLVLDPTCGSGTTAYVAEQWGRRWITIDTSRVALALARTRIMSAKYDWYHPRDTEEGAFEEAKLTGGRPSAGPFNSDLRRGFVYERAPRVTLKSIANNAQIDVIWEAAKTVMAPLLDALNAALGEAWTEWQVPRESSASWPDLVRSNHAAWWAARQDRQAQINRSIAQNAEVELLYDRPQKAKGVVRVAGPFTVESLSPHRVLPLDDDPLLMDTLADQSDSHSFPDQSDQTDFATVVLENLKAAGVQNTKKGGAIKFDWLRPFASKRGYIAFEGQYEENGEARRAAIAIGPEYDTVGYDMVRGAAREASDLFDTLIVCGFAFAPEIDESRLNFGRLTVLKARMNQDLRMGDKLKATGAGNLFVVFGEPDIEVEEAEGGDVRIRIKGVDIFDPTTGEVRSSQDPADDIACWFIDDDYDDESFFVRQAYFLGRDPYESLKRALKAEIDLEAWSELNSTVSRAFPKPSTGRVCVKVINHFGDEVQKVFQVS